MMPAEIVRLVGSYSTRNCRVISSLSGFVWARGVGRLPDQPWTPSWLSDTVTWLKTKCWHR